ncbi:MAG: ribose 5-phosphate isomerase B [Rikenellaceae bacterium]|nr:ribose 5-phosphate isomerase B [Rikenellaceae bacterium]
MSLFTVGLASDHAGFDLKENIAEYLLRAGYSVKDFGCYSSDSCDYPDFAHPLAESIEKGECKMGISICFTANGISMTLNKHVGLRSAICWNEELAELARAHNDANVCSLPAKYIDLEEAIKIVNKFLNTEFEGGRHKRRVDKITSYFKDKGCR